MALNNELVIPLGPSVKFVVDATAGTTLFDNAANVPHSIGFTIQHGAAFLGETNLTEQVLELLASISSSIGNTNTELEDLLNQDGLRDLMTDLNTSIGNGKGNLGVGIKTDSEGSWFYIHYAVKTSVDMGSDAPLVDYSFIISFMCKMGGDDSGLFDSVVAKVIELWETDKLVFIGILLLIILIILFAVKIGAAIIPILISNIPTIIRTLMEGLLAFLSQTTN